MDFVSNGINCDSNQELQQNTMNSPECKVIISEAEEEDIIGYVQQMAKIANPRTRKDLPRIVKYVLDKRRKKMFNDGSNLPSANWVQQFLKRISSLNSKLPNGKAPSNTTTLETLKRFYSRLTIFLAEEHSLNAKNFLRRCNGHRVFTCDEAVFHLNVNEYNSKKQVHLKKFSKADSEGKNTRTVLMCVSASGNVLKPLIINSGITPTQYDSQAESDNKYWTDCSDKGFMTAKVFYHWLINYFEPYLTQNHIERPVILFLDGHFSHLNIPALLFAQKKQIILYCLLTDASHLVQPIDTACFKPMEENFRKILREHSNTAGIVPPKMFPYLLSKTMARSRLQNRAGVGFEETGLVPLNPDVIDKSKLQATPNGNIEVHVPDMPMPDDIEKNIPLLQDSIIVIRAELNALQDFLLRIETILPRPYVAHFEEKHEVGEDVLDHSFFIWRDLKEKIRDIQNWLLQAPSENAHHMFQNSNPSIQLISQDNQTSFVQLQASPSQIPVLSFPVSGTNQNPLITFPEGTDPQNPMVEFHENATLQNVIESFPDNSLENFQESANAQQNTIEGFSDSSTPANPIVTFTESAQHHIECFTENSNTGQNSIDEESYTYQNSEESYVDTNHSPQNFEEETEIETSAKTPTSPVIGKRASDRLSSPIKGKFNLGSLYRNPVVSLTRTQISNGKSPTSSKKSKDSPKSAAKVSPKSTAKTKKEDSKLKRKSIETPKSASKKQKNDDKPENKKVTPSKSSPSPVKKSAGLCPLCKKKDGPNKVWIGCDCGIWCHKLCVDVSLKLSNSQVQKLDFKCPTCNKKKKKT